MVGAAAAHGLAQNKWTPIVAGVVIIGVSAVAYFGIIRPIMCRTGIAKNCGSDKRRKKLEERLKKSDGFNPNFYIASKLTITHQRAKEIADKLNKALSGADDEEAVYALLADAKNLNNLSLISYYYQMRHKQSLVDNLAYDMGSEEELQRMVSIVQNY